MLTNPLAVLILAHADDKLMLGHLQSDWTGLGPILEEDIASSAMAQDDLSHALTLYEYLGNQYDLDPDVIAFERDATDYLCCDLATQSDEFDWANSIIKRWVMAVFTLIAIERLSTNDDAELVARLGRIMPEQQLQVTHLARWIKRLAHAGEESHGRMQAALDRIAPLAGMVLEVPGRLIAQDEACFSGREEVFTQWTNQLQMTLEESGLSASFTLPDHEVKGGRRGHHAPHFKEQLAEMTEVRRVEPGATW